MIPKIIILKDKEQHTALLTIVGNAALRSPKWVDFAYYCFNREKGLRKEAFKYLDNFLKSIDSWVFQDKIEFIDFLFSYIDTVEKSDYKLLPQPLSDELVRPTLEKWCETERLNGLPFRWYGQYNRSEKHIFKALKLNSSDDKARQILINWWAYDMYFAIHHLPEGYIGEEPREDLMLYIKIVEQIDLISDPILKVNLTKWLDDIKEDREIIINYVEWLDSGHLDFDTWGQQNKKKVGYSASKDYSLNK